VCGEVDVPERLAVDAEGEVVLLGVWCEVCPGFAVDELELVAGWLLGPEMKDRDEPVFAPWTWVRTKGQEGVLAKSRALTKRSKFAA
jgi:hypothetical protein